MKATVRNLMFDLAQNREVFDEEQGRVVSKAEANDVLRKAMFEELGLNEKSTSKQIKRALESERGKEFFAIIEELIDVKVATGWHDSEFFNQFVEEKNLADGDANEFWTDDDVILTVAQISGDHWDMTMQKLGAGKPFTVPMSVYGIKVGSDIRLFLTGRKNWGEFIDAVARAFQIKMQNTMYAQFMSASAEIPPTAQFNKTGLLSSATKAVFDTLLEDVSIANDNAPVVIMGTRVALKKLTGLADINWIADSQRESVAHSGLLGDYEGVTLMEIPQRFEQNTTASKLVDSTKLIIMPQVGMKPVKFVDGGESELTVDQKGEYRDDFQSYEIHRKMGISTIITEYFGVWTIGTGT